MAVSIMLIAFMLLCFVAAGYCAAEAFVHKDLRAWDIAQVVMSGLAYGVACWICILG